MTIVRIKRVFLTYESEILQFADWLAGDAVRFEPVSDYARVEMGKIMGKTRKLPRLTQRNAKNPCGTVVSDDFQAEK